MTAAFYLPASLWAAKIDLDGEEAQHARALRLKDGDRALLLDGEGKIGHCVVTHVKKKSLGLEIEEEELIPPPNSRPIMAIALSKAARRGFFLEKASELGAWAVWFWNAERSQGKVSSQVLETAKSRLVAGCKQSLNPWLPRLAAFENVREVAEAARDFPWKYVPWEEETSQNPLLPSMPGKPGDTVYVIGPEGGITPPEMEILRSAAFVPVSLGQRILRCETAAVLCLGLHWWASQLPGAPDAAKT